MGGKIEKRFEVPVEFRWYEVIVEHDLTSISRKIFVDSQMILDNQEKITDATLDDFFIGSREGPRKNVELDIERNRQKLDGVPLEDYIEEHSKRFKAFEVPIGNRAKSKLLFDKDSSWRMTEFDQNDVVWNLIDGNLSFQLRGVVDSRGTQNFKLFANGEEVEPFRPKTG